MEHLVQSDDVRPELTDPHSQDWFVVAVGVSIASRWLEKEDVGR